MADLKAYRVKNPLVKHLAEDHPGESWDSYKMRVTRTHKSPMYRQITEGQMISKFKGDKVLNQKGEWGQNLPPKIVVEDGRQEDHLYTNPEGQNQEKGQEDRKRKVKEQAEGANTRESNHEQIEIESKRKKSKIPDQILSKPELVKCMRTADDGPTTPGMNRNTEGLISQIKGNMERLAGSIYPSEPGDQNPTRAYFSKANGDRELKIDRGPQDRIITKYFRSENNEGQPTATPGKSDIRTGEGIRSTFSFGIPNIVDKEEKPVEPIQQEQESKTQVVEP